MQKYFRLRQLRSHRRSLAAAVVELSCPVPPWKQPLLDPRKENLPSFLNNFPGKLLIIVDAKVVDDASDTVPYNAASGQPGLFIQVPVRRAPQIAVSAYLIGTVKLIFLTNLLTTEVQAVPETVGSGYCLSTRIDSTDLHDMCHSAHPGNQLTLVEYRNNSLHVGGVGISNEGIIVGKYVPFTDAHLIFVIVLNHPLDGFAHRMYMHDDTRR